MLLILGAFLGFYYAYLRFLKLRKPLLVCTLFIIIVCWVHFYLNSFLSQSVAQHLSNYHSEDLLSYISILILMGFMAPITFLTNMPLFVSLIQVIFFVNAWFLYRDLGWTKQFVYKVSKYLSLAWLLGIEVWAFLLSRCLYEGAGQVYQQSPFDTPIYIPYVWSLDNAQFRLDLNHALLLVSIPLSIAVLAWCHKRYLNQNLSKDSP